jgi:hypothetical protein
LGSDGSFREHAALPDDLAGDFSGRPKGHRQKSKKSSPSKTDDKPAR